MTNWKFIYSGLIGLLGYLFIGLFFLPEAKSFTMSNSNFILQNGTLDMTGGKPESSNYKLQFSAGETAPAQVSGPNYIVRSGFEHLKSKLPFTFSLSQTLIDFGVLSPTNPVVRTNTLTVSNGSSYGYSVIAYADHPLQTIAPIAFIADVSCDDGTCNETNGSTWKSTLTYGFGYRCDNVLSTDCSPLFDNPASYRQFADISKQEVPQAVMEGSGVGTNKKAEITYKVNISRTQTPGLYSNTISYIATPTF